jgi:cytochrome c553
MLQRPSRNTSLAGRAALCILCAAALKICDVKAADKPQGPRGDAVAGKRKTAACNGCHAVAGMKNVPSLGGQGTAYFIGAMHAYRDGARSHATMRDVAAQFSERDLADLAAYYAEISAGVDAMQATTPPDVSAQCAQCHGTDGAQGAMPEAPRLAGQKPAYLDQTLRAYRSGARRHPIMQQQAAALTDDQIAELAAYYAGRPGLIVK